MKYQMPEPAAIRDVLDYNISSGVFTWKLQRGAKLAGDIAGSQFGKHWSISVFGKTHLAHRLAIFYITGSLPEKNVDVEHIDGDRRNNAYANLRLIKRTTIGMALDAAVLERLEYDRTDGVLRWTKENVMQFAGHVAGSLNKGNGYVTIRLCGKQLRAHRVVWFLCNGVWPTNDIDHINGNRSDNKIENLRDVPTEVNTQNLRQARKCSISGLLGVTRQRKNKWGASIRKAGKVYWLGTFDTPEEAHSVYVNAKRQLHEGCTI